MNEDANGKLIRELKEEIERLRDLLKAEGIEVEEGKEFLRFSHNWCRITHANSMQQWYFCLELVLQPHKFTTVLFLVHIFHQRSHLSFVSFGKKKPQSHVLGPEGKVIYSKNSK